MMHIKLKDKSLHTRLKKACHEETETRKRGPDGETSCVLPVRCFFLFKTLRVFLCPKRCAHMQVSSILGVCAVVSVCVTAGVSKEGLML